MIGHLKRTYDQKKIEEILRRYMRDPAYQKRFLVEIYSNEHRMGGIIYEGARPLSIITDCVANEVRFTLTNGDSGYSQPIATLKLSGIRYVSELPEWQASINQEVKGVENASIQYWER